MKIRIYILLVAMCAALAANAADNRNLKLTKENVNVSQVADNLMVTMDLVLDSTSLSSNQQLFVTPVIQTTDGSNTAFLPTVLFSGRNMHYAYLRNRKSMTGNYQYDVVKEVWHKAGTRTRVTYAQPTPMQDWMSRNDAVLRLIVDTCGCGDVKARSTEDYALNLNKAPLMLLMTYPVPRVGDQKILVHQGKAKVQFEVDKFELHEDVYEYTHRVTKRKHVIDNREQLALIDDSIRYALSSPNVELVSIEICGYASPESPYEHNEYLAMNRSKAVMMYVERHNNVPDSVCSFSAVPENWAGFRRQVVEAGDITVRQREDLLALIDREIHSPMDYDRKETELATSPKFAELYKNEIHPDWFPELRYTEFSIRTCLKPFTDIQLRDVMKNEPETLSLSQFYRVALSYGHGTPEFHETMMLALKYFPDDEIANTNAAALAVDEKRFDDAKPYLERAGDSDDANILRGIVATNDGNLTAARRFFKKAIAQPEAQRNLNLIKKY